MSPPTFLVKIDGQSATSWSKVIACFNDASIYQSWAYGAVSWGVNSLSHVVITRSDRVVAAAQLRIARIPVVPAGLAYLRWGPLCISGGNMPDIQALSELAGVLRREYVEHRGLELQVLPPTVAGGAAAASFTSAFEAAGLSAEPGLGEYRTMLVNLTPDIEFLRKSLKQKWRNQLNRAEKNGLVIECSDTCPAFEEFVPLYKEMWERKQFDATVDVHQFSRMQGILFGTARMRIFTARADGKAIGSVVCSLMGDRAIYLLGATSEQGRELKAAYLLQWQAMLWLKSQGARSYDLGGIDAHANPGGYHFKTGFGGTEVCQMTAFKRPGNILSSGVAAFAAWRRRRQQHGTTSAASLGNAPQSS